jgi:hypothetical protein
VVSCSGHFQGEGGENRWVRTVTGEEDRDDEAVNLQRRCYWLARTGGREAGDSQR